MDTPVQPAFNPALLGWLDACLHREILRLRARYQLSLDEFRGLYISDEQVDVWLENTSAAPAGIEAIEQRVGILERAWQRPGPGIERLQARFGLAREELQLVLVGAAPELHRKYEILYAYLNDDITRKWATHDLAIRLLDDGANQATGLREALQPDARLYDEGLIRSFANQNAGWLTSGFAVAQAVINTLLDLRLPAPRLAGVKPTLRTPRMQTGQRPNQLGRKLLHRLENRPGPAWVLRSSHPGYESAVDCLGDGEPPLMGVDLSAIPQFTDEEWRQLRLHARLCQSLVVVVAPSGVSDIESTQSTHVLSAWQRFIGREVPVLFVAREEQDLTPWLCDRSLVELGSAPEDIEDRLRHWQSEISHHGLSVEPDVLPQLAERFRLSPPDIRRAVQTAVEHRQLHDPDTGSLDASSLFAAARAPGRDALSRLAGHVVTDYTWNDLVLNETVWDQVTTVVDSVRQKWKVFRQWRMNRHGEGQGIKVLFAGTSGTGKTMTASVLANDLGLDLFKIDLSSVVSKYIGETERNLERIFTAAQSSNAILFFDEADALFGKRSEVKDAHDRYANIEVAYLLQRIESYDGMVVLATNLSRNIDQAFSRRMHHVIDFPMPDERNRERLWRNMFTDSVPLDEDIDFRFLAKQFRFTGGDIRNVALSAAFRAAAGDRQIAMRDLIQATGRQLVKQGRAPSASEFKQYFSLLKAG